MTPLNLKLTPPRPLGGTEGAPKEGLSGVLRIRCRQEAEAWSLGVLRAWAVEFGWSSGARFELGSFLGRY